MGVSVQLRYDLILPSPRRRFFVHHNLFSNIIAIYLVPGFDDAALKTIFSTSTKERPAALVLALYGSGQREIHTRICHQLIPHVCVCVCETGNAPTHKKEFIDTLKWGTNCVVS